MVYSSHYRLANEAGHYLTQNAIHHWDDVLDVEMMPDCSKSIVLKGSFVMVY